MFYAPTRRISTSFPPTLPHSLHLPSPARPQPSTSNVASPFRLSTTPHTPNPQPARPAPTAPDTIQVGEHVITQKSLYTGLFVISIPMLWISSPFSIFIWLVSASAVLILGHATVMEPGIESEYAQVQDSV